MTSEEREAHIRAVVDAASLPSSEDIARLRALLRLDVRASADRSPVTLPQDTTAKAA